MKGYATEYIVYRDDEVVAMGTQREIMEKAGINASSACAKTMSGEAKRVQCSRYYVRREPKAKDLEWYDRRRESKRKYYQAHREEILKRIKEKKNNGKR